jgi:hypothetical protein
MKYYTPTNNKVKRVFIVKKDTLIKKKMYFLFSALTVLLITGCLFYLFYNENKDNNNSLDSNINKPYSIDGMETEQEIEKGEDSMPTIKKAKFQFESTDNIDRLKIIIEETDDDKKNVSYNYEWLKNGAPFGNNIDNITGFKKGDKIDVKITPFYEDGRPISLSIEIGRVTPKIVENREINFDGNVLTYQVKAVDPDGNDLKYSLIDPPKGMSINDKTGMILWQVNKAEDHDKQEIKVRISSANGAETIYPLNIDLGRVAE